MTVRVTWNMYTLNVLTGVEFTKVSTAKGATTLFPAQSGM